MRQPNISDMHRLKPHAGFPKSVSIAISSWDMSPADNPDRYEG